MALTEQDKAIIDAFRSYIEDSVAADDRYGTASRQESADGSDFATFFAEGDDCWFEVAVYPNDLEIRVAFVTRTEAKKSEVKQAIEDSGDSLTRFVEAGLREAGLDWPDPPTKEEEADNMHFFVTPFELVELSDLEMDDVRTKTIRLLEGYLIAFGPVLMVDDED